MEFELCQEFYYRLNDENIKELYTKFNTCKEGIIRNNPDIPPYVGEWVKIKVNDFTTHIVKPTQTLPEVANIYNVEQDKIVVWNNLSTNKLFIGQHLKIYNK